MSTIRKLRKALGLSQEALAQEIGKSYASVRNYEDGRKLPRDVTGKLLSMAMRAGLTNIAKQIEKEAGGPSDEPLASGGTDEAPHQAVSQKEREWLHVLLDYVLDSGSARRAQALRETLLVYFASVRCAADPMMEDLGHMDFVGGPPAEYRVIMPVDFGDGVQHKPGEIVQLRLETAVRYARALIKVEGMEVSGSQKPDEEVERGREKKLA